MVYVATALAVLGFASGILFRLKTVLLILGLVLVVSIVLSVSYGFGFLQTAIVIVVAQTIAQGGYFFGLVMRSVLAAHGPPFFFKLRRQ